MTNADELLASLLASRNADGGWPFQRGASWTEPTALALLALQSANHSSDARPLAASWLANQQSSDGGWPPCASVPTSTWVSSLTLMALAQERAYSSGCPKGAQWISSHVYPDLPALEVFVQRSLGVSPSQAPGSSPWFPGTAGWVSPTAFSILALSCWSSRFPDADLSKAIQRAQTYLLSRRCSDGGWNHGGSLQRSEESPSYPETTGLALLALANTASPALDHALHLAETYLRNPVSPEGSAWLLMGLAAHGRNAQESAKGAAARRPTAKELPDISGGALDTAPVLREFPQSQPPLRPKTNRDIALQLIAFHALRGRNPFLQPAL